MAKKTLGGSPLLADAAKAAQGQGPKLSETVLATPKQINALKQQEPKQVSAPPEEKRTKGRSVYLKPSEYEEFVGKIGRESFSDAVRDLILKFNNMK